MLIYIPFIYFTTWLILHLCVSKARFGAGAMSLLWVDLSALFAIILDARNLYGEFGCNPNAISLTGIIIYCLCWTIALYPLIKLDKISFDELSVTKPRLFTIICYVFIFSMVAHIAFIDIDSIIAGFTKDMSEAYSESLESGTYQGGAGNFIMWIPNIISSFGPLYLMLWFISLTLCRQNRIIRIGLLLSSMLAMISGVAAGGRAQLIWWFITFMIYFYLFKPTLSKQHIRSIYILLISAGSLVLIAFLAITLSRFDDGGDQAMDSFIGYAGQQINNFCTIIPHAKIGPTYPKHILPLSNYIINHEAVRLQDYHAIIGDAFPYQMNVFFTFFGDLIHDIGLGGLCVFMIMYMLICSRIVDNKQEGSFTFAKLLLMSILIRVPVEGLFSWPFVNYRHSLFMLFTCGMFFIFQYTLKYGQKRIL